MDKLIFVYGTLKKGYGNNTLLHSAEFVGNAQTVRPFKMYSYGGFPVVFETNDDKSAPVYGEMYRVKDARTMHSLDSLEGHPDWFCRTPVVVKTPEGEYTEVEMYIGQPAQHNVQHVPLVKPNNNGCLEWHRGM